LIKPSDVQTIYDNIPAKDKKLLWIEGMTRRFDDYNYFSEKPELMLEWFNHTYGLRNCMLKLRPTCENCNKALPPDSLQARICTYECTFCATCVDNILGNVCPNCGGGFAPRPIWPKISAFGSLPIGCNPPFIEI
jgi:hypothetical protein